MSPHVYITRRKSARGESRYIVRYRWGGRGFKLIHLASKQTQREARALRDWAAGELAAARDPREMLRRAALSAASPIPTLTLDGWWDRFIAARVDTTDGTQANYRKAKERFSPLLGSRDPFGFSVADVREAVTALELEIEPSTLHGYVSTLRQVLDFAAVEPNVARDRRLKLPQIVREEPEPPDAPHVQAMVRQLTGRWLLAFVTAEQTGMRVGEIASVCWGDVDVVGARFRIRARNAKSRRAKWVPVPGWLMDEIAVTCVPEDRLSDLSVFPHVNEDGLRNAMLRACRGAGIPVYSPHDLRHRRITIWHHAGMPTKQIQERVGHAKASVTLDTYAHVMPVQEMPADDLIVALRRAGEVSVRSRS
jgi:integrase